MNDDLWITVPGWEKFQHYGPNRAPIWIKNYTALLHKDDYLDLTLAERGLLHGIWLAYAENRGHLRAGPDISRKLSQRTLKRSLNALSYAGFVGFSASRPLDLRTTSVDACAGERPASALERRRRAAAECEDQDSFHPIVSYRVATASSSRSPRCRRARGARMLSRRRRPRGWSPPVRYRPGGIS